MTALNFLDAAACGFRVGSDKLRDLPAEERAEQGTAASKAAEAALAEAMRGTKPAAASA